MVVGVGTLATGVTAAPAAAAVGGISYFCICRIYASACGIEPQQTSNELVEARTSCTRPGTAGLSVSKYHRSLQQTFKKKKIR